MWYRIELKNYRSIESAHADLAPFTVLIGPNGSGKSNFADALVFVGELDDAASAVARRGGIMGLKRWQKSPQGELLLELRTANSKEDLDKDYSFYRCLIEADKQKRWKFSHESMSLFSDGAKVWSIVRGRDNRVNTPPPNQAKYPPLTDHTSLLLLLIQLGSVSSDEPIGKSFQGFRRCRLSPEEMRKPHTESNDPYLDELGSNIAESLQYLREKQDGSFEDVLTSMARIVPDLVEIETNKVGHFWTLEFHQRQASGEVASFTAMEMSDGALRALGILVAAQQVESGSLLVIEEPEVHLHPGATAVLFEALKNASRRGSVLITTHSPELLDAAKDEEILVCDYRLGSTRIGPLAAEQRQIVREGLFSTAELMRTTRLRIEGDEPAVVDSHGNP